MTRINVYPDPSIKEFEAYTDFSGGRNTETSNEQLKVNEYPELLNVDLTNRTSCKRRSGRTKIGTLSGVAQGLFFYFRAGQPGPDIIEAIDGKLYVMPNGTTTQTQVNITDGGNPFTFQSTLPVQAVQYGTRLYVATGTKLVELFFDVTWQANTVVPYTPTVLEAIYIGVNALAPNPNAYIQDGTSTALEAVGIQPSTRTGTAHVAVTMTGFTNKPASITSVDYKWEYKKSTDTTFTMGRDWTNGATGKTWNFTPASADNYDIKLSVRDAAVTTTTAEYTLANYIVNVTEDKANNYLPYAGIQKCRGILLHWDRILLYGDDTNPFQMYVSDLENPYYFPATNTINYNIGKLEPITTVTRFRSQLVVFTDTTIQTLIGKAPDGDEPYRRYTIHDGFGCTQGDTAKVVGNNIIFKSAEGIMMLRPNPYQLETLNVQRIDRNIQTEILNSNDADACALVYNNQYWICFPQEKVIHRFYYEAGIWTKDSSTKLDVMQFIVHENNIYNLSKSGVIYKHDSSVYDDDGEIYTMIVDSKHHDLEASFNFKKLKRLYVMASSQFTSPYYLRVYADNVLILTPESGQAVIGEDGYTTWETTTAPNMTFYGGTTFGTWLLGSSPWGEGITSVQRTNIRGKSRRVKVSFQHQTASPCELYGFGIEYKLKKPY